MERQILSMQYLVEGAREREGDLWCKYNKATDEILLPSFYTVINLSQKTMKYIAYLKAGGINT